MGVFAEVEAEEGAPRNFPREAFVTEELGVAEGGVDSGL